ncbi:hypothetical protein M9Y10_015241 [Tritrichomonas musculus]|uniref:Uncharacterized protein n=1 Tax=Tritrichomonas musculus TaxID=1915356 RepID=A0ABR2L2S9_9EUKA
MLFALFSFIQSISLSKSNAKISHMSLTSYQNIVDFSKFQPQIAIRIVLFGFTEDNSFINSFESILKRFLSSKRYGIPTSSSSTDPYINLSLVFSVNNINNDNDDFYRNYIDLIGKPQAGNASKDYENYVHVAQDSEFTNIFSNLHAKEILKSSKKNGNRPEKYTLVFVNHSTSVQFQYEKSKEYTNCLIFEFNSGFCHISPTTDNDDILFGEENDSNKDLIKAPVNDKNAYLAKLFKYTSVFVEQIIIPDLLDYQNQNFLITPSKIIFPVVTFGPEIKSLATLQKEITSLFSPIESLMIINRQNLYEFPIVATALQTKIGSNLLFTALGQSQHIFGSSLGLAILDNDKKYRRWREKIENDEPSKDKKKNDYKNFTETVSSINRRKVASIYLFNSRDDRTNSLYFNLNNNNFHFSDVENEDNNYISAIFESDEEKVLRLLLSAIAKVGGNVNFLNNQVSRFSSSMLTSSLDFKKILKYGNDRFFCAFGGHHPFFPYGGVRSFSSIFSDVIIRNFALSNILISYKYYIEAQNKLKKLRKIQLSFLNSSLQKDNLQTLQKLIVRTSDRINNNEVAKAVSSSSKAAEISLKILNEAEELLLEASVFGNCCPETVYISKTLNNYIVVLIVVSFFGIVVYAFYKLYQLFKKKRITPKAFL